VQDLETQIIMQSPTLRASDPITVGQELIEERRRRTSTAAVHQPPLGGRRFGVTDHGEDWRDANASCDEEVPRRRDEWKVVPRPANPRRVAFTQAIVDER
jgi:hypothetical protein